MWLSKGMLLTGPCSLKSTTRLYIIRSFALNDLPSVVSSPIKIFVDDVVSYCPATSTADCKAFQKDLDLMLSYYHGALHG